MSALVNAPARFVTKMDFVAQWLRDEILSERLSAGTQLLQDEVAERLGVSSTPVREAFGVLESEGFLERRPHRGVIVAQRAFSDVADAYEIRMLLEGYAARRVAMRRPKATFLAMERSLSDAKSAMSADDINAFRHANSDFHVSMIQGAHSATLLDVLNRMIPRSRVYGLGRAWMSQNHREHLRIIAALREGDGDAAARLLVEHNAQNVARLRAEAAKQQTSE